MKHEDRHRAARRCFRYSELGDPLRPLSQRRYGRARKSPLPAEVRTRQANLVFGLELRQARPVGTSRRMSDYQPSLTALDSQARQPQREFVANLEPVMPCNDVLGVGICDDIFAVASGCDTTSRLNEFCTLAWPGTAIADVSMAPDLVNVPSA